jgi:hypothetical protein
VSTQLRVVRAKVVEADTPAALEAALNAFFKGTDRATFLQAYHLASLTVLVLYADG